MKDTARRISIDYLKNPTPVNPLSQMDDLFQTPVTKSCINPITFALNRRQVRPLTGLLFGGDIIGMAHTKQVGDLAH